jgi:hypothetical protein
MLAELEADDNNSVDSGDTVFSDRIAIDPEVVN